MKEIIVSGYAYPSISDEALEFWKNEVNYIKAIVLEKDLAGVDFDFEYIPRENREQYVELVDRTRQELAPIGAIVTVAMAPKASPEQGGILYEGHDYSGMGQAADYLLIMTYEWGYTFGPAMAVAPIDQVRRVVDYAVSEIPYNKIWLGVPNYGYDFTLPYVKGVSKAEKLSNEEAKARAKRYGVEIQYDEKAQSPFYIYVDNEGRTHEVWFENESSYKAKANLIYEYDLAGMGIWNIMYTDDDLKTVINEKFER